ncbi:MAG: hypothetical protein ACI4IN_02990 [Eubacterium sp.]
MDSAMDRLISLFSMLGLNTDDGTITKAEIEGYCAGIDAMAMEINETEEIIFSSARTEYAPLQKLTTQNFEAALQELGGSYSGFQRKMILYQIPPDKLGEFWQKWGIIFLLVRCAGQGASWDIIDAGNSTWHSNDNLYLLWNMIDTLEVNI